MLEQDHYLFQPFHYLGSQLSTWQIYSLAGVPDGRSCTITSSLRYCPAITYICRKE